MDVYRFSCCVRHSNVGLYYVLCWDSEEYVPDFVYCFEFVFFVVAYNYGDCVGVSVGNHSSTTSIVEF